MPIVVTLEQLLQHRGSIVADEDASEAIGELIASDGQICESEIKWATEIAGFFADFQENQFEQYYANV